MATNQYSLSVQADAGIQTEYNILLLGETGVGKSTFINAFANYLTFETLDDAIKAKEVVSLIPTKFTVTNEDFEAEEIIFGSDENECYDVGASATQCAKLYKFPIGDVFIRIIDTPGIGDTRGIEKDEKNFDNLLTIIGQFKNLHAICILLKPNNARLTVLFEYCIKQLLSRLERSAAQNMVFLFTNSRNTFYRPGDTLPPLKRILDDIGSRTPNVKIPFSKTNVFCMDNEAFRFLVAKKKGIQFSEREKEDFAASWLKSAEVCLSLLAYLTEAQPHKIQNTISVNEARRLILILSEPLAKVAQNIEDNVQSIQRREEDLRDGDKTVQELMAKLYVPVIKIRNNTLPYPRTVCADVNCTETVVVEDVKKIHYKTACHDPCQLKGIAEDVVGTPNIIYCHAFGGNNTCRKCGHFYTLHLHIYYTTEAYSDHITDINVADRIQSKQQLMEEIKLKIEELKERKKKLEAEKEVIQISMAKFAHFLKNSAIAVYNDKYKEYIELLINREKGKGDDVDKRLIRKYEQLINNYEHKKRILDENLAEKKRNDNVVLSAISADEVIATVKTLYKLEINGPIIRDFYETVQNIHQSEMITRAEKVYKPSALRKFTSKVKKGVKSGTAAMVNYLKEAL